MFATLTYLTFQETERNHDSGVNGGEFRPPPQNFPRWRGHLAQRLKRRDSNGAPRRRRPPPPGVVEAAAVANSNPNSLESAPAADRPPRVNHRHRRTCTTCIRCPTTSRVFCDRPKYLCNSRGSSGKHVRTRKHTHTSRQPARELAEQLSWPLGWYRDRKALFSLKWKIVLIFPGSPHLKGILSPRRSSPDKEQLHANASTRHGELVSCTCLQTHKHACFPSWTVLQVIGSLEVWGRGGGGG